MKLVKYFLQKKAVTILLLVLILAGGLFSYIKMGKLEDAPFTIKQALVLTPYPGAFPLRGTISSNRCSGRIHPISW